ncbi:hypothetical protein J3E64_001236 [Sphingobium sp. OAS761]|uniref:DUF1489 domain-containing protein n=1 Tax=Sphingobium sp. OAS761 TaxID=2817901 RepID=UPI00209F87B8|nr:DUF1489 domain-containing protein [Sphingobium sp. OAS761]MCP1469561.1 hypothetical protein [Sphingobium sp. OAS761]
MPLHITKIAFGSESPAALRAWLESQGPEARITTRYLPKRIAQMDGGSLYWIHQHRIVGRSPILGFEETGQGRYWVRLAPRLIPVRSMPKRAHQGWRYLEQANAPPDLADGDDDAADVMPPRMLGDLTRLGLL